MQITMRSPIIIINSRIRLRRWLTGLSRLPKFSTAVILAVVLSALGAGLLTSSVLPEANQIDLRFRYAPPWPLTGSSPAHLLGTDRLGRDLLSRMLVGAQNSLAVALLAIAFAASVGTFLGLVAGYLGGWVDGLIMRCVDIMMSFPAILVALVFLATGCAMPLTPNCGSSETTLTSLAVDASYRSTSDPLALPLGESAAIIGS